MRPRGARRITAAAVLGAALLAASPPSAGALTFTRCARGSEFGCARVPVPVDRSGAVPGTVNLFVERRPASRGSARGTVLVLAGGPGQAATPLDGDFAALLASGLRARTLIVLDQRGTGKSGLLRCAAVERLAPRPDATSAAFAAAGEACAAALGPARAHYTTVDAVEDIESVRRALGVRRLTLYAVSYGTKVAEAYAKRYPAQVQGLVLDSVVLPTAGDPLARSTLAALPRVLGTLCAGGACERIGAHPLADMRRLSRRFDAGPQDATAFDGRGRRRHLSLDAAGLAQIAVSGDFDPVLRADLPGAVQSALHGDRAPLARALLQSGTVETAKPRELSDGVFAAATCEEAQQLWARNTPIQNRLAAAAAAIAALPEAALDPFGRAAELKENTGLCLDWPTAPAAPDLPPGPLPDVPALVLSGRDDLRTPLEDARAVASLLPHARLLAVPRVGHAVLFNDTSGCATRAVAAFFAGGGSRGCAAGRRALDPTEAPPVGLRELDPLVGLPGTRGRTVRAALLTLQDIDAHSPTSGTQGGLRGGYLRATRRTVELHNLVFVPGVRVSGLERGDLVRLSVAGSAASRARLTLTRHGVLTGIVGGRVVRLVLARALAGGGARGWLEHGPAPAIRAR